MSEEKLVPKLRFSGFDDEWIEEKLGNLVQIKSGECTKNLITGIDNSIPYFKVEQLNNSLKYQIKTPYFINDKSKIVNKGSIIFPKRGAAILLNKIRILNQDSFMDTNLMTLTPNNKLYNEFLYYFIYKENLSKIADTTSIPQLNNKHIKPYPIKLPSFEEQLKISKFISSVDKKVALLSQNLEIFNDFKKGLLQQIFTQKLRFDDNCQYKTKQVKDFLIESKIEGIDDINKRLTVKLNLKGITVRESKTIEIEGATKQFIRKTGQFIYGKQNLHKGAFGIIPKELDGYLTSSDIPSFDFKGGIEPKWFYYYFARKSFYEKLENLSTGTGSKRISPKEFLNIKIIVPEFKEQHKIVCLLEKFDEKINGISNQIVQMNMFKKSLLQQMFV
ncbi:restriction endonuclease subunit S [Methanobrevibacter smithii]